MPASWSRARSVSSPTMGNLEFLELSFFGFPYIAGAGEMLIIFAPPYRRRGPGFFWFNTYPAMVFMGDIGALRSAPRSARWR